MPKKIQLIMKILIEIQHPCQKTNVNDKEAPHILT